MNNNTNTNEILQKVINHIKKNEHHNITQQVEDIYNDDDNKSIIEPQAPMCSLYSMPHGGIIGIHMLSPDTAVRVYNDGYRVMYNITNNVLTELPKVDFDQKQDKSIWDL